MPRKSAHTTVHAVFATPSSIPRREREDLLAHVLGRPREWMLAHLEAPIHPARVARYRRLVARLTSGEPLPHLLGEQWFYGRPFRVTRDVLIPRPETELVIERAIEALGVACPAELERSRGSCGLGTIVDVGTGSGCIAITLAKELTQRISNLKIQIVATDTSPAALRVARANARRHGVADRITFLHGNLLTPLRDNGVRPFTRQGLTPLSRACLVILANLPYLTTAEWCALPHSIREYEPRSAFDGGPDGLAPFRALFKQLRTFVIRHSSFVILEVDPRHKRALAALVRQHLPKWEASWHQDLAGRWRVLELSLTDSR